MKLIFLFLLGVCQLKGDFLDQACSGVQGVLSTQGLNEGLKSEILDMQREDQRVRANLDWTEETGKAIVEIDQRHQARLKAIIAKFGWPGIRLIGLEGASAMWLLVQHQDQDLDFQKKCLTLLKNAVENQDAAYRDYVYLLDRVRMNEGLEQVYGTQWVQREGVFVLHPVENLEHLNARRAEAGLCSLEEYKEMLKEVYHLGDTDIK